MVIKATQTNIYDNCRVLTLEDTLHGFTSHKRAKQLVKSNRATIVQEYPLSIQLNFEPPERQEDPFYLQLLENICVGCGTEDQLSRHHVVPKCYQTHFPVEMKRHLSHDILPMCIECHDEYETYATQLKKEIEHEYETPVLETDVIRDLRLPRLISHSNALQNCRDQIPPERIQELERTVMDYLGKRTLTDEDIRITSEITLAAQPGYHVQNGQGVVAQLDDQGIKDLIRLWREHFIAKVKPKYMPKYWSVTYRL